MIKLTYTTRGWPFLQCLSTDRRARETSACSFLARSSEQEEVTVQTHVQAENWKVLWSLPHQSECTLEDWWVQSLEQALSLENRVYTKRCHACTHVPSLPLLCFLVTSRSPAYIIVPNTFCVDLIHTVWWPTSQSNPFWLSIWIVISQSQKLIRKEKRRLPEDSHHNTKALP